MADQERQKMPLGEKGIAVDAYRKRIAEHLRGQLRQANAYVSQGRQGDAEVLLCSGIQNVLKEFIDPDEAEAFMNSVRNSQYKVLANQDEMKQFGIVRLECSIGIMDSLLEKLKNQNTRNRVVKLKELILSAGESFIGREEFLNQLFSGSESSTVRHFISRINNLIPIIEPHVRFAGFPHGNCDLETDRWVGFVLGDCPIEMPPRPTAINDTENVLQRSNDERLNKLIDTVHLLSRRLQADQT